MAFRVTTGEGDDRDSVEHMAAEIWGHLCGDRSYISRALHDDLLARSLKLITLIRRNTHKTLHYPVDFAVRRPDPKGAGARCHSKLQWAQIRLDESLQALSRRGLRLPRPLVVADS